MKRNTLYLMEMGMNDEKITTDIKNHRVRVVNNIDIVYDGEKYNLFFEFTQGAHWYYRTRNKRNGEPLKKPVTETILKDGIFIDTQYEKEQITKTGYKYMASYRLSSLEKEFYIEHLDYSRKSILEIVNRYKVGEKFTDVCLIKETAKSIILKNGGFREKEILGLDKDFHTQGDSFFEIGKTWNDEHKIVTCNKREWETVGHEYYTGRKLVITDFCGVDLVTGKITD